MKHKFKSNVTTIKIRCSNNFTRRYSVSGFDKGTEEKSEKFLFDCDSCLILFTRNCINIAISFSFSLHNLPFYTVFRSRAVANIAERLILSYRSLRFSDRNSIIDCSFGITWRVFGVQLIDKVARTLFHSSLLFLLR